MNESVSFPSILAITAPPKETSTKVPRAATDDFREQLSSHSKADENRGAATKKKDVELERSSVDSTNQKQVRPETEQEATSPGEAVPSADQENLATTSKDEAPGLPESEETLEALAEGLIVSDQVIATPVLDDPSISKELFVAETTEEIIALTGNATDDSTEQRIEPLEIEIASVDKKGDQAVSEKPLDQEVAEKVKVPEVIATSAKVAEKKTNEQESVATTTVTATSDEEGSTIPVTANEQPTAKEKNGSNRSKPSLLAAANAAAVNEDGKEQDVSNQPFEKSIPPPRCDSNPVGSRKIAAV